MSSSFLSRYATTSGNTFASSSVRLTLGLCFCLCAYLGNVFNLDMFFGFHFLFGGVFVWLAMAMLGPFWAIIAAFIGSLYTTALWGNSYAVVTLTLEAVFVSTFFRSRWTDRLTDRLSVWVLAYWILLGGPLAFFLVLALTELPSSTALLFSYKQVLNGLLNALIAAVVVNLISYFSQKVWLQKTYEDRISYSGLLHAVFGVLLVFPFLFSEMRDLRNSFQQNVASTISDTQDHIRTASTNFAKLLELETSHWGNLLANLKLEQNNPEIQQLIQADTSAAPTQIYVLSDDNTWLLLYGPPLTRIRIEDQANEIKNAEFSEKGHLLGCQSGYFTSHYSTLNNATSFVFTWSPDTILSSFDMWYTPGRQIGCLPGTAANLQGAQHTSAALIRDQSLSNDALNSWLMASVVARTNWEALSPTILELTNSLKPMVLQIQKETANTVERLCILTILVIVVGQILDVLFKRWLDKFGRISEAWLKFNTPPSDSLNLRFQEDRKIANWLDQFATVAENAEENSWLVQQNLRMLLAKASTPVFGTDSKGKIKVWNPALESLSGYAQKEVLEEKISNYLEVGADANVSLEPNTSSELLIEFRTKSGGSVHLVVSRLHTMPGGTNDEKSFKNADDNTSPIFYFIAQNLNELRESQAKLIHASRLAALGEMASSYAHELNQPLNVITLSAGNILERAKEGSLPQDYLISKAERIESQALRAGKIIQGIRNYVLEIGDEALIEFDPVHRSQTAVELIREQLRLDSVTVHFDFPAYPIRLKGRPLLFEQAMVNLFMNSKFAMKDNDLSERQITISFTVHECELTILVKDTGPGISKNHLNRVFDPFFSTTKKDGGTGIGLYMTQTVVNETNGSIRALDVADGACIEIKFPPSSVSLGD